MDRATLLNAVAQARTAATLGRDDLEAQRPLDGKRFEVRIRFGCSPPQQQTEASAAKQTDEAAGPFKVSFDEEKRTLRLSAAPDISLANPQVATIAGESAEAVEGFWLPRPWLLTDGCPAVPPKLQPQSQPQPSEQGPDEPAPATVPVPLNGRVGIARFFTETDSRTGRRDHRAYELTKALGDEDQPSRQGYNLVLSGRLRQLGDGRVIHCPVQSAAARPNCLVSAQFDRVWIEQPGSGEVLADWSN